MSVDPRRPIVVHPALHGEVAEVPNRVMDPTPVIQVQEAAAGAAEPLDAAPAELSPGTSKRAHALDALRGLFLISMTLGFSIQALDLPLWMYHVQQPPPTLADVSIPGISWRDLAFGAFLFTMAAALPLTLSRRIAKADTELAIVFASIKRYLLLMVYALIIGHSNTYFTGYTQTARVLALVGFVILGLIFTRRRADWDEHRFRVANGAGWVLALALLAFSPLLYDKTFSFARIDDIIAGLAFASLTGAVTWYFTRDNLPARFGVLAIAVAMYLGARDDGWLQQWWYSSPIPWAFGPSRLNLLTIVIPGTIIGDVLLRWMRASETGQTASWGNGRMIGVMFLSAALTPLVVVGLYNRAVLPTTQLATAIIIVGLVASRGPGSSTERMLRSLFAWGAVWLLIGLFLEPFEGGIKKAQETLSYFFTIAGLTTMLLVTLGALIDGFGRRKWVATLVDVGQNPLLMYVVYSLLITSLVELIVPLRGVLRGSPGESFVRSVLETTAAVLVVRYLSRKRIYWRA